MYVRKKKKRRTHVSKLLARHPQKLDFLRIFFPKHLGGVLGIHDRQRVEIALVVVPMAQDDIGAVLDLGRDVFEVVICL